MKKETNTKPQKESFFGISKVRKPFVREEIDRFETEYKKKHK